MIANQARLRRRRPDMRWRSRKAVWFLLLGSCAPRSGRSFSLLFPSRPSGSCTTHHAPHHSYKGYPDEFDDNIFDENDPFKLWSRSIKRSSESQTDGNGVGRMVEPVGVDGKPLETPKDTSRIRSGFDKLFAGMPSMSDILGGNGATDDEESFESGSDVPQDGASSGRRSSASRGRTEEDYSWFEEEKRQILGNYDEILKDMLHQLEDERKRDPESIPDNADAMVKSVLKEEMERELLETRERRARERLSEYESLRREEEATKDISGPMDSSLKKLMEESEEEYARIEHSRAELDEFLRYEAEAFRRATERTETMKPAPGSDLDQWALDRLQAMASRNDDSEEGQIILDILEENVKELQSRLEKQSKKGTIKPDTMKEWQMYRAIASRLANDDDSDDESRERRILSQLESWKEYLQKETGIRAQAGLARGPKLPFEWQESSLAWDQSTTIPDKRSRVEVRKEINRMSIEAMERLLDTSDPSRKENLRREIEFLKSTLESRDYLDIDEEELQQVPASPVDLSDVFVRRTEEKGDEKDSTLDPVSSTASPNPVSVPNTPFFAGAEPTTSTNEFDGSERVRPPNTPFFTDFSESSDVETVGDSKLGGMEEQKLNAMFRRSGIRSKEEQDVIRRQWEDFKRTEQAKRVASGLSSGGDAGDSEASIELKYNVSDVILDGGDVDAEKILATIGPRPKRSKAKRLPDAAGDSDYLDQSLKSSVDEEEVRDSLYRAVSAIGGGRYKDDPESRAKQQSLFDEFLEKEEEMRQTLDKLDDSAFSSDVNRTLDDKAYAEEVLSSLGPRPKPKRAKIVDEGEFSDKGGVLASEDDDDDSIAGGNDDDDDGSSLGLMPDWLRKERAEERNRERSQKQGRFPGSEISDAFDDDYYDHNMRQLHEYEQRRSGRQRQMGIDISDVLGRSAYETDDYADYKYDDENFRGRRSSSWGTASFESRKRELLQYTELDLMEVNLLMDHKDSVYATGVSQYLPRINKPFKEFGAIFRLEGVLVDVTGLHFKAWMKVAEEIGFRKPTVEEAQRASVLRAEVAVKEAFYWTDDVLECRRVAQAHKDSFRKVFNEWRDSVGLSAPPKSSPETPADSSVLAVVHDVATGGSDSKPVSEASTTAYVGSSSAAWAAVANQYGKAAPSEEEVWHAASLSVEEAILEFGWTEDPNMVIEIAQAYRDLLQTGVQQAEEPKSEKRSSAPEVLDETAVMETHYYAWRKVAERFNYDIPDPEAAVAAFVINDPELAIREGFGWIDHPDDVKEAAKYFRSSLEELLRERSGGKIPVMNSPTETQASTPKKSEGGATKQQGPSPEEFLEVEVQAWSAAARKHGLPIPTADMVQLTQGIDPEDAIRRMLKWTDDATVVSSVATTYQKSLNDLNGPLRRKYGLPTMDAKGRSAVAASSSSYQSGPTDDEIFRLALDAWSVVAKKNGFDPPDHDQILFALTVGPEEAILTGFQWTDDRDTARTLLDEYKTEVGIRRQRWNNGFTSSQSNASSKSEDNLPPVAVATDVAQWVKSLLDVEMQCVVVSFMEQDQLDTLLGYAGLSDLFDRQHRVSSTTGYYRDSQQLLGAALRLERRPDHCVVFDCSPQASIAAHENNMQNVNLVGPYPRYELLASDSTAGSFQELTAMNIRRLFGERIYDQPQLETQAALPVVKRQPTTQTRFWDEE